METAEILCPIHEDNALLCYDGWYVTNSMRILEYVMTTHWTASKWACVKTVSRLEGCADYCTITTWLCVRADIWILPPYCMLSAKRSRNKKNASNRNVLQIDSISSHLIIQSLGRYTPTICECMEELQPGKAAGCVVVWQSQSWSIHFFSIVECMNSWFDYLLTLAGSCLILYGTDCDCTCSYAKEYSVCCIRVRI